MSESIKITLKPHPDIELNFVRETMLEAFITLPKKGVNEDTGLIMIVGGFDEIANTEYQEKELRPFLADKFNCIVVGTNYFGIQRNRSIRITPDFIHNFNRIYNLDLSVESFAKTISEEEIYRVIAEHVVSRGITSLDLRCQPTIITGNNEYQSWGFLPAVDCLQVLGEVLKSYPVNAKRIMVYGKSYGAYVAMLMGKFAPHTFAVIIDREGYSRSELKHIACGEFMDADYVYAFNIRFSDLKFTISSGSNNPWTIEDELSPFYFSDNHRKIRSLLEEKHRLESETSYYIFHSETDGIASIADKDRNVEILKQYNKVQYNRFPGLEEPDTDGIQLTAEQYADFSDQELFTWLADTCGEDLSKTTNDNDFKLNSVHLFDCGAKKYQFQFDDAYNLSISII